MDLKSAQNQQNGKYPMLSYILFLSLIFGFQCSHAMELGQDELDRQLIDAVMSYYDLDHQATAVERVHTLLYQGANPNTLIGERKLTPLLYIMLMEGRYENGRIKRRLIELLIRAGTNPNCIDQRRIVTPLALSCAPGNGAIFDLLVERGGNIHRRIKNNKTLLHSAAGCSNLELCENLLRSGFDVNAVDDNGETPLHTMCNKSFDRALDRQNKILAIIELLLDWGAQINLQNNRGMTALHVAIAQNASHADIRPLVKILLARGADLSLLCQWNVNIYLQSPLELAALVRNSKSKKDYKEHRRLCELIVTHQVLVNKGILSLLGSLRKTGLKGNHVAGMLYRHRNQLLSPYLQRLYVPLHELLRRSDRIPHRELTELSGFRLYKERFPHSKFNIDFLDITRIPETYQNLNHNIYRDSHQPRVIGLTESNQVSNNNNNNEPQREINLEGTPALAPNDDAYDDSSDDDNDNIWNIMRTQNAEREQLARDAARQAQREAALREQETERRANDAEIPQLNSNNSNIFFVTSVIAAYCAIGYIIYKCYTYLKNKSEKQKSKKQKNQNKDHAYSIKPTPVVLYA